jgi:hypothetical protein
MGLSWGLGSPFSGIAARCPCRREIADGADFQTSLRLSGVEIPRSNFSAGGFADKTARSRLKFGAARRAAPTLGIPIRVHLPAFAGCSQTAEDCRCYNAPLSVSPCLRESTCVYAGTAVPTLFAASVLGVRIWFVGCGAFAPEFLVHSASRPYPRHFYSRSSSGIRGLLPNGRGLPFLHRPLRAFV